MENTDTFPVASKTYIGRDPSHRKRMAISRKQGREAISEYKTLKALQIHTLLEFHPLQAVLIK